VKISPSTRELFYWGCGCRLRLGREVVARGDLNNKRVFSRRLKGPNGFFWVRRGKGGQLGPDLIEWLGLRGRIGSPGSGWGPAPQIVKAE